MSQCEHRSLSSPVVETGLNSGRATQWTSKMEVIAYGLDHRGGYMLIVILCNFFCMLNILPYVFKSFFFFGGTGI
jgi:hypothetical protein